MNTRIRNDDLKASLEELGAALGSKSSGFSSGWLRSSAMWAFYSTNGAVRHLVNRFATLMTKAGWDYKNTDVDFDWSIVQSDLESLKLKNAMRSVSIWALVFGGAAIFIDVDDGYRGTETELKLENVRGIDELIPMSALGLRPEPGYNYATAEYFEVQYVERKSTKLKIGTRIHRSRLAIVVGSDVPPDIGFGAQDFINSATGWPPSWLEGIFEAFADWKSAECDISKIIRTKSLLFLELAGLREAARSPDSEETEATQAYIENIADTLGNESLLAVDVGDGLSEIERSTAGLAELSENKKLFYVASTGAPMELAVGESTGSISNNDGPVNAYNDVVDGMRVTMLTSVVERVTEIDLQVIRKRELLEGNVAIEIPARFTVDWKAVAQPTNTEKSTARASNSQARERDFKTGLPLEVIATDPNLAEDYPGISAYLAEQADRRAAAGAMEEEMERASEELVPTAVVAKLNGVRPATILEMRRRGMIEGYKLLGRWKFSPSQVRAVVLAQNGAVAEVEEEVAEEQDRIDKIAALMVDATRTDDEWTVHNMLAHPLMSLLEQSGYPEAAAALHELTLPSEVGLESLAPPGALADPHSFAYWLATALESMIRRKAPGPGLGLSESEWFGPVFGASAAMREIFAVLERVAPSSLPVLIFGESGTGKEGVARGIHEASDRAGEFVSVNCGALPYDASEVIVVVEEKLAEAEGGTLFLDEIGELSEGGQAALLRALGSDLGDVRLVSATWRDLDEWCFRLDLRTRLSGVEVEIPPLRERGGDVEALARMFYARESGEDGGAPFTAAALDAMRRHAWPGNVRELVNAVKRGFIFAGAGAPVEAEHLQLKAAPK